ncbi:CHAT domain-containing protein [Acidicapsa dinghuensis]|uniref:CHAT domain-containing protein n=1 Tax=Acidicapsa dinghuensis TaxID=2218256 RepID=A0ABW1ERH9_9BACT|nr:CHAT domain-containing protein [Acidicapsa dinghuensis]
MGWSYLQLGDSEHARELLINAERLADGIGNIGNEVNWMKTLGYLYRDNGALDDATSTLDRALLFATQIDSKKDILDCLEDLAHLSIETGDLDSANKYIERVAPMAQASGSALDIAYVNLARGKLAAARHEDSQAESLFRRVESDPASQVSMRFAAEHELALLYQAENRPAQAEQMYRMALTTFEGARQQLKDDDSKLPFVANAKGIYDDYVRFLVSQNKPDLALMTADQSRARTLAQGLGMMNEGKNPHLATVSAQAVARKADATLLFYWLGERQSYLWAVTPHGTTMFPLPAEKQITPLIERYNRDLLGTEDPVESGNTAGQQLYRLLVEPAEKLIGPDGRVMLLTDGPLSRLNFEALIVPANTGGSKAHYWIEDATVSSAPSISMLAGGLAEHANGRESNAKLLLLGDPQPPSADYPALPYAGEEMAKIEKQFGHNDEIVYAGPLATPAAYLSSKPEGFPFIHFVSHGVASRMDPLDSAIILSRPQSGDEDSFKLYAREIMRHPIQARLVTISACYGSGTRAYTGEGLVGLSWAFLRAGAQRTIGALWEASDRSTPELMSTLYEGLETGQTPASSLRNAKLKLLHSGGNFRKPFYWAAFQLYTRV